MISLISNGSCYKRFMNSASVHITKRFGKNAGWTEERSAADRCSAFVICDDVLNKLWWNRWTIIFAKKSHGLDVTLLSALRQALTLYATCNQSSASTILIGYINRTINTATIVFQFGFSKKRFYFWVANCLTQLSFRRQAFVRYSAGLSAAVMLLYNYLQCCIYFQSDKLRQLYFN